MVKKTGEEAAPRARATYEPARRHLIARARSDARVQQLLSTVLRESKIIPGLRTRMVVAMVGLVCSDQLR